MEGKTLTAVMIGLTTVFWIGWDFWVLYRYGVEATISRVLYHAAVDYPIIAVAIGVLIGHLFASQQFAVRIESLKKSLELAQRGQGGQ